MTPVLLVHGPGRSARALRPLAQRLAALGHRVAAPDLPPEVDRAAGQALRALDGDAPAVVVGTAGGSRAALALARQAPDRVARLVLVSPSAPGTPTGRHVGAVVRSSLREVPSLKPSLLREDLRPGLRRRVRALRDALAEHGEADLPVPVLVVVGDRDAAVDAGQARDLAGRAPDGRLVVVQGGAHELHWSAPHVLARLVDRVVRADLPAGEAVLVPRSGAEDPLAPPRRVPSAVHAALDLVGAALALGVPRRHGWGRGTRAVLSAAGVAVLANTLVTEHATGVVRRVPVPLHLNLDSGGGLLLVAAAASVLRGAPARERLAVAALGLAGVVLADVSSAPVGPAVLQA